MDEKKLIRKIINKDQKAFKLFVDKYQVMVINICMGFLHNRDEAKDLAQEVFIQAYLSIDKFREDASLSTWLYRITSNKALNHLRSNEKRKNDRSINSLQTDNTYFDVVAGPETNSDFLMIEAERKRNLHMAIDALPENQKTAFVLSKYEDLSYKEIADVMELSVSSVESLLFRARKGLQKSLTDCYEKMKE